ncbi:hypothetical protein C1N80_07535 [Brachybacterium sp. SGAir0954]|nr:hypothetical protein C1N80_07535 [Brachybacterium sp. SGAir0954]
MQARNSIQDSLVGTWTLGAYETEDVACGDVAHPLVRSATGPIMHAADGYMSVQISDGGRALKVTTTAWVRPSSADRTPVPLAP